METNCVSCVVETLNIILMYFTIRSSKPSETWNCTLIFLHFTSHGQVKHIKEVTFNDSTDGLTFIRLGNGVQDVTYGRNLIPPSFHFVHQQWKGIILTDWLSLTHTHTHISNLQAFPKPYLKMETVLVSETLVFDSTLMHLIAKEDFTAFIHCESFKSYKNWDSSNYSQIMAEINW